jgi:imidazolonepropionase-like amidohydrolase
LSDGLASVEHIEELYYYPLDYSKDEAEHEKLASLMAGTSTAVTTTLVAYHNIFLMARDGQEFVDDVPFEWLTPITTFFGNRAASEYVNDEDVEGWARKYRALQSITTSLYAAGVPLVVGTDTGPALTVPGYSYHRELQLLNELGIPTASILAMATKDASRVLGYADDLGSVRKGAIADLMLVRDNPLDNIGVLEHPDYVIKNGDVYGRSAISALRSAGEDHIGVLATIGQILEHLFAYGI